MTEIDQIREKHGEGHLQNIKFQLAAFLQKNLGDFRDFSRQEKKAWEKDIDLFTCLKLYILAKKTIDCRSELESQIEEIKKAVRERAQNGTREEIQKVKVDWTKSKAGNWRSQRTLEVIFVLNQDRELFLKILRED